jgi:hypothetical protein
MTTAEFGIIAATEATTTPHLLYQCCGDVDGRMGNQVAVFYGIGELNASKPFICFSGTPSIHVVQFQTFGELRQHVMQANGDYLSCKQVVAKVQELKPEWQIKAQEELWQLPWEWF